MASALTAVQGWPAAVVTGLMAASLLVAEDPVPLPPIPEAAVLNSAEIVPPAVQELTIDLGTAFRLAETQNPRMAVAREMICEAIAQHKEARALWLPTVNAGGNYHLHSGVVQTSYGRIQRLNEQSLYLGSGARAIGAGTVAIPGLRVFAHAGDAYYLPLSTWHAVAVRTFESQAVENLTLLDVADRYLSLVSAEARRDALRVSLQEVTAIENAQKAFAAAGQGRDADYRRARTERLLIQLDEQKAQEEAAVAAAELSRLLHLDPAVRLVTPPGPIELLELVEEGAPVELLVDQALHQRPEVASRSAEIQAAEYRFRNERMRPWLPLISVGFSGGAYGGGSNRQDLGVPSFYMTTAGRTDFDIFAVWTIQNLGAGNHAWQGIRQAERDQAVYQRALILAQIRREVAERQAQLRAQRRSVNLAWLQLSAAERGAHEELLRTHAGEALPLEALNSVTRLAGARLRLLDVVIEYDRAELRLFVAMGMNPQAGEYSLNEPALPAETE